jgi:hypothetical protein
MFLHASTRLRAESDRNFFGLSGIVIKRKYQNCGHNDESPPSNPVGIEICISFLEKKKQEKVAIQLFITFLFFCCFLLNKGILCLYIHGLEQHQK